MSPKQAGLLAMALLLAGDAFLAMGIAGRGAGWFLCALLLVNSISIAIGYPAFTVLSLSGVPPERQGVAAGIQSTLYTVAAGLGLSFISLCLDALGSGRIALLACCGIVGVLCLAGLIILVRKPKKAYLCPPI
jgi:predicted MFS family arabinose efflux permease